MRRKRVHPGWLAIIAFLLIAYGGWLAVKQLRLQHWPTATATVLEFDEGIPQRSLYSWYANPEVRFAYTVEGQAFESVGLNPSPFNYQSQSRFKEETSHLEPGTDVACWYNPTNPQEAYVVNVGVTAAPLVMLSLGGLCAMLLIVEIVRSSRSSVPASSDSSTP